MEFATREATIDGRRYFTGIIRDLSGRWDEASFGRIIEDSLNEIFVFDAETWRFVQVNRGARNNLGYSLEELRKLTPLDIHPKCSGNRCGRIHPLVTGEKSKIQFETIHKRKDGSCYFVELHLHRAIYRGTSVLVAIILDITERRRAEELLRRFEKRATEAASSGILITDPTRVDNPIVTCNRAFLEITGYSAEEVVGANCRFLQRDDRDQDAIAELREAVADGKKCRVLLRNYRKDGIMFWNELQVSPVRDDQGRVTHFVGILADVTQREKKQNALNQVLQEKSEQLRLAETELISQSKLAALRARRSAASLTKFEVPSMPSKRRRTTSETRIARRRPRCESI